MNYKLADTLAAEADSIGRDVAADSGSSGDKYPAAFGALCAAVAKELPSDAERRFLDHEYEIKRALVACLEWFEDPSNPADTPEGMAKWLREVIGKATGLEVIASAERQRDGKGCSEEVGEYGGAVVFDGGREIYRRGYGMRDHG